MYTLEIIMAKIPNNCKKSNHIKICEKKSINIREKNVSLNELRESLSDVSNAENILEI